ncbi:MAG: HEAT repeat domain-containing protein [Candidatus Binatia bacterium]
MKSIRSGFAVVALVPWLVAGASLAWGTFMWLEAGKAAQRSRPRDLDESAALRTARLALQTARAESEALRRELDRLILGKPNVGNQATTPAALPQSEPAASSGEESDLARRAREALASGDPAAAGAIAALANSGPQSFPELRDLWLSNPDPASRRLILPTLLVAGGLEQGLQFIASELPAETDPEIRDSLLNVTSAFVSPQMAPAFKDAFLGAAHDESNPALQAAAVRGLRYSRGPDADEALLVAAGSASEDVRIAAFDAIALRPSLRERLRELIAREGSEAAREVGHCQLLLAERRS